MENTGVISIALSLYYYEIISIRFERYYSCLSQVYWSQWVTDIQGRMHYIIPIQLCDE
jgi:hypothetical protein